MDDVASSLMNLQRFFAVSGYGKGRLSAKIAATEDGTVVLVMDSHPLTLATLRGAFLFTYDAQSKGSYESYDVVP
jgi:hypothetical protein